MEIPQEYIYKIARNMYSFSVNEIDKLRDLPVRNTYLLKDDSNQFILKIYTKANQLQELENSIDLQKHLNSIKFNIPKLINNVEHKQYSLADDYLVICQEYIAGSNLNLIKHDVIDVAKYLKLLGSIKYHDQNIVHGDFLLNNGIRTKSNEIYFVDWDYSHLGNTMEDIEYFIKNEIEDSENQNKYIFMELFRESIYQS